MRRALLIGLSLTALFGGCTSSPTSAIPESKMDGGMETSAGDRASIEVPTTSSLFHLIDDMDHADENFPAVPPDSSSFFWRGGTSSLGNWFVSSPDGIGGDARIDEIVPPRGDSKKACHVVGSKHDTGVDLWAQLNHPSSRPVDLSAFAGIAFWARLGSPSGKLVVAINDHNPGTFFSAEASQTPWPWLARRLADSEWERIVLLFDDFGRALDTSAVVSIDFVVGSGGESFDLWIDDLTLLCRGACQ